LSVLVDNRSRGRKTLKSNPEKTTPSTNYNLWKYDDEQAKKYTVSGRLDHQRPAWSEYHPARSLSSSYVGLAGASFTSAPVEPAIVRKAEQASTAS
jgi:hypothetical protein